jgi:hypothetical protein
VDLTVCKVPVAKEKNSISSQEFSILPSLFFAGVESNPIQSNPIQSRAMASNASIMP